MATRVKNPPASEAPTDFTVQPDNPFETSGLATQAVRGGANLYGANSIETFCDAGPLSLTHDDADGWVDYVDNFTALNFRYRDAGVKVWQYYEQYDNWQDTYGADAVCAFYHSGHGGMDANGVFYLPMGAAWAGNDCTAISSNMRLGNEHGRYMFLSTCESLRVLSGHNPIRTWQGANLGLRMIFGYETVSWDDPNYGKYFWQEWQKNKSFGTAWLDASWRIAHDQAPSVVACGATQQEAQDRVFNERYFNRTRPSTSWWWWRWYNAARSASREPMRSLPREMPVARLRSPSDSAETPRSLADRFGLGGLAVANASRDIGGGLSVREDDMSVVQDAAGGIAVRLGAANLENTAPLAISEARGHAEDAIRQYGLGVESDLIYDRTIQASSAGGTAEGSGRFEPERVTETIVQFRQTINGVPVISSNEGAVRVSIDNDGKVTQLQSSVRQIEELGRPGRSLAPRGPEPRAGGGGPEPVGPAAEQGPEAALDAAVGRRLRDLIARGAAPVAISTVPGSTEVGYAVRGDLARLVTRKAIEIDFGSGYRKRYWVEADVSE